MSHRVRFTQVSEADMRSTLRALDLELNALRSQARYEPSKIKRKALRSRIAEMKATRRKYTRAGVTVSVHSYVAPSS